MRTVRNRNVKHGPTTGSLLCHALRWQLDSVMFGAFHLLHSKMVAEPFSFHTLWSWYWSESQFTIWSYWSDNLPVVAASRSMIWCRPCEVYIYICAFGISLKRVYRHLVEIFAGIGVAQSYAVCMCATYYASLVALTLRFFISSFNSVLPWSRCKEEWGPLCIDSALTNSEEQLSNPNGTYTSSEYYF